MRKGKQTEGGLRLMTVLLLLWSIHASAQRTSGAAPNRGAAEKDQAADEASDRHFSSSTTDSPQLIPDHLESEEPARNDSKVSVNGLHAKPQEPRDGFLLGEYIPPEYAVPINGYLIPTVAFVTAIGDSLLCIVLLKKEMRSPTDALFVAIAISDMLTGLIPAPVLIYFFATDRFWEFVPYEWCSVFFSLAIDTPRLFHTASVWLTTTLGVQRYICVCHPLKARTRCTMKKTLCWIGAVFLMSIVSVLYSYFEFYPIEVERPSAAEANKTVSTCRWVPLVANEETESVIRSVYHWYLAIAVSFIPCVILVVMNVLLIRAMRQAEKRRVELLRQNRRRESRRLRESTSTTLMLVIVVSLFLLVEIPVGIFKILESPQFANTLGHDVRNSIAITDNLFIVVNNSFIFVVYCTMSKKFRNSLKHLLTPSCRRDTTPEAVEQDV
ncbi:hypothetical protein BaRGS_00023257 [Batillaria attramentaria]|uniref:G-protein coupled receptors family 1 profile domain-containing protein n=1 Tax=Batillaria attramentaria TaxID=370345 RepID=A0ABD0KEN2_9CAEN